MSEGYGDNGWIGQDDGLGLPTYTDKAAQEFVESEIQEFLAYIKLKNQEYLSEIRRKLFGDLL